jgi:hypothetical protein
MSDFSLNPDALRPLDIPPGDCMIPHPSSAQGMRSPQRWWSEKWSNR